MWLWVFCVFVVVVEFVVCVGGLCWVMCFCCVHVLFLLELVGGVFVVLLIFVLMVVWFGVFVGVVECCFSFVWVLLSLSPPLSSVVCGCCLFVVCVWYRRYKMFFCYME